MYMHIHRDINVYMHVHIHPYTTKLKFQAVDMHLDHAVQIPSAVAEAVDDIIAKADLQRAPSARPTCRSMSVRSTAISLVVV